MKKVKFLMTDSLSSPKCAAATMFAHVMNTKSGITIFTETMPNIASNILPAKLMANTQMEYSIIMPTSAANSILNSTGIVSINLPRSIKAEPMRSSINAIAVPRINGRIYAASPER